MTCRQVSHPSSTHKVGAPSFRSFIAEGWETMNPNQQERNLFIRP